jgi:hypothetical protein
MARSPPNKKDRMARFNMAKFNRQQRVKEDEISKRRSHRQKFVVYGLSTWKFGACPD